MKTKMWLLMLTVCVALGGCSGNDRRLLDDLGLILAAGYDEINSQKVKITATMPMMLADRKSSPELLSVIVSSGKEARKQFSFFSGKRVEVGQIKVILFGEKTARSGIRKFLHPLYRDPTIGSMMFIGVVKGKAYDALKADVKDKQGAGFYLYNVLRQEAQPRRSNAYRLNNVIRDIETVGRDTALPYMLVEKQGVRMQGLALFKDARMTGKLPSRLVPAFTMLYGMNYNNIIHMALDKRTAITLSFVKNTRTRSVSYRPETEKVQLQMNIRVKGQLLEYKGKQLKTKKQLQELEKRIARHLEQECDETIRILQKAHSDALAIGSYIQAKNVYPEFDKQWWQKQYPQTQVKVKVKVKITRIGLLQ